MPEKAGKMRGVTDCRIFDFRDQLEWQRYCSANGGAMGASTHCLHFEDMPATSTGSKFRNTFLKACRL
jgi:hypothetical protein